MMREIEKSNCTSILHSSSASLRLATELAYLNRIQGIRGKKEFYITLPFFMRITFYSEISEGITKGKVSIKHYSKHQRMFIQNTLTISKASE